MELAAESPLSELDSLRTEIARLEGRNLGLLLELMTLRRRQAPRPETAAEGQDNSFISGLVPAIETLQRALNAGGSPGSPLLHQGVEMALRQLRQLLRQHGVETEKSGLEQATERYDPAKGNLVILRMLQCGEHRKGMVLKILKPIEVGKTGSTQARLIERT
jgi:molecular chaperone GrpE